VRKPGLPYLRDAMRLAGTNRQLQEQIVAVLNATWQEAGAGWGADEGAS